MDEIDNYPSENEHDGLICGSTTLTENHDQSWQESFVIPIAKIMKKKGIGSMCLVLREDGKVAFDLIPK